MKCATTAPSVRLQRPLSANLGLQTSFPPCIPPANLPRRPPQALPPCLTPVFCAYHAIALPPFIASLYVALSFSLAFLCFLPFLLLSNIHFSPSSVFLSRSSPTTVCRRRVSVVETSKHVLVTNAFLPNDRCVSDEFVMSQAHKPKRKLVKLSIGAASAYKILTDKREFSEFLSTLYHPSTWKQIKALMQASW